MLEANIPLVEDILEQWRPVIGTEYNGYKNHVYRMIHFCLALKDCDATERKKIVIAACFHDIGIWTENTVDYIAPSIPPALNYLGSQGLADWSGEIELMISEHHKIRKYDSAAYPLVELFRRGDLVDFSFGLFKFGIPPDFIKAVREEFPNAGFHSHLMKRAGKWFLRHPLNPLPMMKW